MPWASKRRGDPSSVRRGPQTRKTDARLAQEPQGVGDPLLQVVVDVVVAQADDPDAERLKSDQAGREREVDEVLRAVRRARRVGDDRLEVRDRDVGHCEHGRDVGNQRQGVLGEVVHPQDGIRVIGRNLIDRRRLVGVEVAPSQRHVPGEQEARLGGIEPAQRGKGILDHGDRRRLAERHRPKTVAVPVRRHDDRGRASRQPVDTEPPLGVARDLHPLHRDPRPREPRPRLVDNAPAPRNGRRRPRRPRLEVGTPDRTRTGLRSATRQRERTDHPSPSRPRPHARLRPDP